MTTAHTPTPLPFLVPAANLAAGDVLPDSSDGTVKGGTIAEFAPHSSGVIQVVFTDRSRAAFTPDVLVEVIRRPAALAAVVAELTALADTWEHRATLLRQEIAECDAWVKLERMPHALEAETCAHQLRALIGRLA